MNIEIKKYLGKWFEVAKISHIYENNMTNVTAEYEMNGDGSIKVVNSGYVNGKLKQVTATAYTTNNDDVLKISFVPNIYSEYKILAVDKNYQYALVGGMTKNHLWILSRTTQLPQYILNNFLNVAEKHGYNINRLKMTKN